MLRKSLIHPIVLLFLTFFISSSSALAYTPRWFNQPNIVPETETDSTSLWEGGESFRLVLEPGMVVVYEGNLNGWSPDRLELTVLDVWEGGVTWSFSYYDDDGNLEAAGLDTQTSLDVCKSVVAWRIPEGKNKFDDSCDFFISPTQFRELISNKRTYFRTELSPRSAPVRLEKPNATKIVFKYDGREVEVDAIEAVTTRRELMVILNDPQTPLLLVSSDGDFKLKEIRHKKRN